MAGRKSLRADKIPPRKTKVTTQMVDVKGSPLSTEQGAPLVTEKDSYIIQEYGADYSTSVVIDSESYLNDGLSTANSFSKGSPAALPVIEKFPEQSEVSRSLLGIDRKTKQQGLFSNVSSYGLDPKDWRVDSRGFTGSVGWWDFRPSASGNYYDTRLIEDDKNSSIGLRTNPTPFLVPPRPSSESEFTDIFWGQYINSVVALYLIKYAVRNLTKSQWEAYNLTYMLNKYPPINNGDGTFSFNELYWDKIWLDINQNRFDSVENYPVLLSGTAYNFKDVEISNFRNNPLLWGTSNVIITEANSLLPPDLNASWDSLFFASTRMFFPEGQNDDQGHFRIKTNPVPEVWERYYGFRWSELRQDLKDWEFTIHSSPSTVTQLEIDLKLPYFVLSSPIVPDPANNTFSDQWPKEQVNLPTTLNRIGGTQGVSTEIVLRSIRAFRYQPGRISGFTYGVKVSEIGAGPGTTIEFGIENDTDSYMFRLSNGANFSIIRRSIIQLDNTTLIQDAGYTGNTKIVTHNGRIQYETVIEQKNMNGDPLSGEGETGYILNLDTVTMYKIEFGWYGAIGAKFYAYVPVENDDCRWVVLHTLVIENQLGKPCLADPFFYFKYRLNIQDSSSIRIDQYIDKFGASYYIDGYDEGTLYSSNVQSGPRTLLNPGFSESKTRLNAIDWTTLIGVKPIQFLQNKSGEKIYNKKEIFPTNLSINSRVDCEIKIITQRGGCLEFAYSHQEGYAWGLLPEHRRLKGKFSVISYYQLNYPEIGILEVDPSTHTAVLSYSTTSSGGFRNPSIQNNWEVIGDQPVRVTGPDLFALIKSEIDFPTGSVVLSLKRVSGAYTSSSSRFPITGNVKLPFIYAPVSPYENGYDVEFDYFRRDQILLSTIDVVGDEFYIYWTGGSTAGISTGNSSSIRFGFVWPESSDTESPLYSSSPNVNWGIEPNASYDGETFYEGLPYDFVGEYKDNSIYVESNSNLLVGAYGIESGEISSLGLFTDMSPLLSVPGIEGGLCRGLFCKITKNYRKNLTLFSEQNPITLATTYYISDTSSQWPVQGSDSYPITIRQGSNKVSIQTTGGIIRVVDDITIYLLPLGNSLPLGISTGTCDVYYNTVLISSLDSKSNPRNVLTSRIAPGDIPFVRVFVQGRQGSSLGGVWVGQRKSNGILVDHLTPHRSTLSISDTGSADYHSEWSSDPRLDGAVKVITPITQLDSQSVSTAPTFNAEESNLDTRKSIHTSPRKCGSFLSTGRVNSAGIFTKSEYPLRWLTQPQLGNLLSTHYITANESTIIDLTDIFGVSKEGIVNDEDSNLAMFIIGRSLVNDEGEINLSFNYTEQ